MSVTHLNDRTFTRKRIRHVRTACGRVFEWNDVTVTLWGENCTCKKCRRTHQFNDRFCLELEESSDTAERPTFQAEIETPWGPAAFTIERSIGGWLLTYFRGGRHIHSKVYERPRRAVEAALELTEQTLPRRRMGELRHNIYRWLNNREVNLG